MNAPIAFAQSHARTGHSVVSEMTSRAGDIEGAMENIAVLMDSIYQQVDGADWTNDEEAKYGSSAINCFTTCIERYLELITQAAADIHTLGSTVKPQDTSGWIPIGLPSVPDNGRDVLVWSAVEQQPMAAFFDEEEDCWFSKYDGHQLERGSVTHWREIQMPEG